MDQKKATQLVSENYELWKKIGDYNNTINLMKKKIITNEKIIYKSCIHDWEYDESCGPYDRIKYKCKKCSLFRSSYMYS